MDAHRPRPLAHFTPASGWINDPLALTWHGGRYHLFFQYVPDRTSWAPECRWGHASSPDLVTWTEHPVALEPGDGDDGVWSGSIAIADDGRATIFYTSVSVPDFGVGRIRTATPVDDDWLIWEKGDVVVEAPDLDLVAFRDPFVMRDGDGWRMLVGTAIEGGDAAAASYFSNDLVNWAYDGLAARRNTAETEPVWTGALWECPQVFRIDGRDVMVTSVWQDDELHYVAYGVGAFRDGRFEAEHWGRLTYGDGYYAPSFFRDEEGRPCLIFWLRGAIDRQAGWASALSVPHVLTLDGDRLDTRPHPTLGEAGPVPPSGMLASPAFFCWRADEGDELRLNTSDDSTIVLRRAADGLDVVTPDARTTLPLGSPQLRVLVDQQTLEIITDLAVMAVGSAEPIVEVHQASALSPAP